MRPNKYTISFLFAIIVIPLFISCQSGEEEETKVGVFQLVTHPVLDSLRVGVADGLGDEGYTDENTQIVTRNAQGDMNVATSIVNSLIRSEVDILIPLGTQATQTTARATNEIPIVFGAVIDPVGVGVVNSLEKPGTNVTGTRDVIPYEKQINLLLSIAPDVESVGMVYNSGESNSSFAVKKVKEICQSKGLELNLATVSSSADVLTAARSLQDESDALYTAADNTVNSAMESFIKAGREADIPVLVSDPGSVKKGAIGTVGYDYYDLGVHTAQLASKILEGAEPNTTPVQDAKSIRTYLNQQAIDRLNYSIPDTIDSDAVIY